MRWFFTITNKEHYQLPKNFKLEQTFEDKIVEHLTKTLHPLLIEASAEAIDKGGVDLTKEAYKERVEELIRKYLLMYMTHIPRKVTDPLDPQYNKIKTELHYYIKVADMFYTEHQQMRVHYNTEDERFFLVMQPFSPSTPFQVFDKDGHTEYLNSLVQSAKELERNIYFSTNYPVFVKEVEQKREQKAHRGQRRFDILLSHLFPSVVAIEPANLDLPALQNSTVNQASEEEKDALKELQKIWPTPNQEEHQTARVTSRRKTRQKTIFSDDGTESDEPLSFTRSMEIDAWRCFERQGGAGSSFNTDDTEQQDGAAPSFNTNNTERKSY